MGPILGVTNKCRSNIIKLKRTDFTYHFITYDYKFSLDKLQSYITIIYDLTKKIIKNYNFKNFE